jgi:hypothetical protein
MPGPVETADELLASQEDVLQARRLHARKP